MAKKKSNSRQFLIEILTVIICTVIVCVADHFIKFGPNSIFNRLSSLSNILFSVVTIIVGIWVTYYLLFFQIYKDRYTLEVIKERNLPKMRKHFLILGYLIIFGSILLAFKLGGIYNIWFIFVSVSTILIIMIDVYKTSETIMANYYIGDSSNALIEEIKNCNNTISECTFKQAKVLLDDCIVKEEYFVIQTASTKWGALFRAFLNNSMRLLEAGSTSTDIKTSFEKIIEINIHMIELCPSINSELVVENIINQQASNLEYCIKTNQYECFKEYLSKLNRLLYGMLKDQQLNLAESLLKAYERVFEKLISEDKIELLENEMKELMSITSSITYVYKNINICSFILFLASLTVFCIEESYEYAESIMLKNFEKITRVVTRTSGLFNEVKAYYSWVFMRFQQKDILRALKFFEIVTNNTDNLDDPNLVEFKLFCISSLNENSCDFKDEVCMKILEYHTDAINSIISLNNEYRGFLVFPDFEKLLLSRAYEEQRVETIVSYIEKMLWQTIIKDNPSMFFLVLDEINSVLAKTKKAQKDIQIKLFSIYTVHFHRTKNLTNKQFLEITFDRIEDIVLRLDKERVISDKFAEHIIRSLTRPARHGNSDDHILIANVINLFMIFTEPGRELYLLLSSVNYKQEVYKQLFIIGTSCIENNFEEGLRRVSNAIGWGIINSLQQSTASLTTYLIGRAKELFDISKRMDVSEKTQTFMLTLFTTVGAYCCKEIRYQSYISKVISCIDSVEYEKIRTAVILRTGENDMWDDLFENRTQELTNQFLERFKKAIPHN